MTFILIFLLFFLNANFFTLNSMNNNYSDIFENKNVLIFGGTGFIGKSLAKEILKYKPHKLIIFSRDEVKHFSFINEINNIKRNNINFINKRFNSRNDKSDVINIIGDIRDFDAVSMAVKDTDIVIHAAALKRIDILEENVNESIKTNILGTYNVFNACLKNKVKKVLFISTDKACLPINTYGASKFIGEKIFTNNDKNTTSTQFITVRYGNVLQSTGSIVPIIVQKIQKNEDLTLTDPRMTRFIIDKNEAIELIFDALLFCQGGEILIKKLPSIKVIDLIEILKEKLNANNKIKIIGMRPGEKLHEILMNESEAARAFEFDKYYVVTPNLNNWLDNNIKYIKEGKKVLDTVKFSSEYALISKEEGKQIIKKISLF